MEFVAGDDVCQSTNTDVGIVGEGTPVLGFAGEITKEGKCRSADRLEVGDQTTPRNGIEVSGTDIVVLLESGERSPIITGEAKRAVAQDSFRVRQVRENFLDGPFLRPVAGQGLLFGNALKKRDTI